jgi:sulfate adenylyltransferase subunit 1 (EFTu-like GTPase family)
MAESSTHSGERHPLLKTPAVVAVAGWVVPGLGYVLLGERTRGFTIMITVLTLFISGLLIAGIRVIDVPGYDKNGFADLVDDHGRRFERSTNVDYDNTHSALFSSDFVAEVAAKPWYVGQIFAGPINLIASVVSVHEAQMNLPMSHARLEEIGTLYTAVAGMLNLLAILDASSRAASEEQSAESVA